MSTLTVALGARSYPITIGAGTLTRVDGLRAMLGTTRVLLISDEHVAPLYAAPLVQALSGLALETLVLPAGEAQKSLACFERICTQLLQSGYGRDTTLIALGGGVIGDLVGFVAACYQRGVPFVQIPTSLLAQVDSSVGGKTAINHPLGKNMLGAIYQPQLVVIDTTCLATLPRREFAAGLAEVIKYGVMWDSEFFAWLETHLPALLAHDQAALTHAISRCCAIKADIVARDETEQGERALLNLGHTFGHAIETAQGYGQWLHGEAVAVGIWLAALCAAARGQMSAGDLVRLRALLLAAELPIAPPAAMPAESFLPLMRRDKKNQAGKIRLVLPVALGQAHLVDNVTDAEILAAITRAKTT
ncbi:MAG: 3-dehydroquinate synthase [Aeromonas sp.]